MQKCKNCGKSYEPIEGVIDNELCEKCEIEQHKVQRAKNRNKKRREYMGGDMERYRSMTRGMGLDEVVRRIDIFNKITGNRYSYGKAMCEMWAGRLDLWRIPITRKNLKI